MAKTVIPKLEDWKAPWETKPDPDDPEKKVDVPDDEQVVDKDQLKRYLHGLLSDKARLQDSVESTTAEAEELQQKLATAKTPAELAQLQEENATLVKERDEAREKAKSDPGLKWEIALEKGLTKVQAKRLMGSSREELEQDADELLAEFGHRGDAGDSTSVRSGPRRNLQSGGDPDPDADKGKKEPSPEEVVAAYFKNR